MILNVVISMLGKKKKPSKITVTISLFTIFQFCRKSINNHRRNLTILQNNNIRAFWEWKILVKNVLAIYELHTDILSFFIQIIHTKCFDRTEIHEN